MKKLKQLDDTTLMTIDMSNGELINVVWHWSLIIQEYQIPEDIIRKHIHKIPIVLLVKYQPLSTKFIRDHLEWFEINDLFLYQDISDELRIELQLKGLI